MVEQVSLHVVTAGQADKSTLFLQHGFPENWQAFEAVVTTGGGASWLAKHMPRFLTNPGGSICSGRNNIQSRIAELTR